MCGISGIIYRNNISNSLEIYEALLSLQHRGQDGAGICAINKDNCKQIINSGLICNIFKYDDLLNMTGNMFIGHNRYKTNNVYEAYQPFNLKNENFNIFFCHNGNIINVNEIEDILKKKYKIINEKKKSDSFLLFQLIFYYLNDICINVSKLLPTHIQNLSNHLGSIIIGSYSIILAIEGYGMIAIKDKKGIRPLIYGKNDNNDILISSESCSINILNYTIIKDVEAGETIVYKNDGGYYNYIQMDRNYSPCLFEYIYFSSIDSILYNISIYNFRYLLGQLLGKEILKKNLQIDFIIPTPETSRIYAYGLSNITNIDIQECIIKNRYINRTFIMDDKSKIKDNINRKFSVIKEIVRDKNVLLIDDSVVRGNTSKKIIRLLRKSGVKNVYFCSAAPKILNENNYGIYIESKKELITYTNKNDASIANAIGANLIVYNTLEKVTNLIKTINPDIQEMELSMFDDNIDPNIPRPNCNVS